MMALADQTIDLVFKTEQLIALVLLLGMIL